MVKLMRGFYSGSIDSPNLLCIYHIIQSGSRYNLIVMCPKHNSMNLVKTFSWDKILLKALKAPLAQPNNAKYIVLGLFQACLARFLEPN